MFCTTCGSEVDAQGGCPKCSATALPGTTPPGTGDPFATAPGVVGQSRTKSVAFTSLALVFTALILALNYLKALRWAGVMNAESFGYMLGGVLVAFALGVGVAYTVEKLRHQKMEASVKMLCASSIGLAMSVFALAGEVMNSPARTTGDINHQMGDLLREAAGKKVGAGDADWWDSPSRDFFHDILVMNEQYAADVKALDSSAIKDLYSAASYSTKARMQKTVDQLHAAQAVDEKYASLDPIIQRLKDRVAAADASERQKQEFLDGLQGNLGKSFAPRTALLASEQKWMNSTIDLYEFNIAHFSEYSVKGGKLYFRNPATREEFTSRQSEAMAQHKDFLSKKKDFEAARQSSRDKLGVSNSEFTPEQLGKPK